MPLSDWKLLWQRISCRVFRGLSNSFTLLYLGVIADDTLSFTSLLNSLWFGEGDSSESLFTTLMTGGLGEGKILNWLKFYNLEKEGTVNYMGYYGLSEVRLVTNVFYPRNNSALYCCRTPAFCTDLNI